MEEDSSQFLHAIDINHFASYPAHERQLNIPPGGGKLMLGNATDVLVFDVVCAELYDVLVELEKNRKKNEAMLWLQSPIQTMPLLTQQYGYLVGQKICPNCCNAL